MHHRRLAAGAAAAILALGVGTATARAGTNGEIVLRLTLRGPVSTTDTFFVGGGQASDGLILPHGAVCGPPSDLYNDPELVDPCEARTYEVVLTSAIGTQVPVGFSRDESWDGTDEGSENLYAATVTVTEGPQTYTFVYDYGLGMLPDTAATRLGSGIEIQWLGLMMMAAAAAAASLGGQVRLEPGRRRG
jgi:hypothetical protein